jgi:hypothetical protein
MRSAHSSYDSAFVLSVHPNEQAYDNERQASPISFGKNAGPGETQMAPAVECHLQAPGETRPANF